MAALERERRLLSCLKKDEREVLIDLLRRLHGNLGAVTGHAHLIAPPAGHETRHSAPSSALLGIRVLRTACHRYD